MTDSRPSRGRSPRDLHLSRRDFLGFSIGAFVVAAVPIARRQPVGVIRRTVPAMGTLAHFAVVHRDPARAHAAIDAAVAELRWVEQAMTRFNDASDIGRANLYAHRDAVVVTPETARVVDTGLRWASALDGRYDPAAGAIVRLWDVRNRHEPPPAERVAELGGRHFYSSVEVGVFRGSPALRYHDAATQLDLGSVAKGFGVDRAADTLRRAGIEKAIVVAGGDVYALGRAPDDEPWRVGVQSPDDEREIAETLLLENQAVATSGTYRQFFSHRGRRYHHIMDPATAAPRETPMRSLSIVAESVMHADAASTALFGMSETDIHRELARNLPGARLVKIL